MIKIFLLVLIPLSLYLGFFREQSVSKENLMRLEYDLGEKVVSLKDQLSFAKSPHKEVRLILAQHDNTETPVLKLLSDDHYLRVKIEAYKNLQKRSQHPLMRVSDYRALSLQPHQWLIPLCVLSALISFIASRKKREGLYSTCWVISLISGLLTVSLSAEFNGKNLNHRKEVVLEKMQRKSITPADMLNLLEEFSGTDAKTLVDNAKELSDAQVETLYKAKPLNFENEMKTRRLIKPKSVVIGTGPVTPKDFN